MKILIKDKKINASRPETIAKVLTEILKNESKFDRPKEHFWGVYLNTRNIIIRIELISLGTINATIVHPREVLRPAIQKPSASIIIAHNHPSDDTEPSEDDIVLTKKIKEACEIMGIELLDHIIITEQGEFYSMNSNNKI
jgi:DNA repair protein RadC